MFYKYFINKYKLFYKYFLLHKCCILNLEFYFYNKHLLVFKQNDIIIDEHLFSCDNKNFNVLEHIILL